VTERAGKGNGGRMDVLVAILYNVDMASGAYDV